MALIRLNRRPAWWRKRGVIAALWLPLASLFAGLVALRREAYRRRIFPVEASPVRVIVVGNIAVGGSGKTPVVIDKEVKGFIGNRLQFALLREAWALWADGVAKPEVIDAVVRTSFGRRVGITGPIESADIGGLETMYNFARFLQPDISTAPEPPAKIAEVLKQKQGTGEWPGLYDWKSRDRDALVKRRMDELFRWLAEDRRKK